MGLDLQAGARGQRRAEERPGHSADGGHGWDRGPEVARRAIGVSVPLAPLRRARMMPRPRTTALNIVLACLLGLAEGNRLGLRLMQSRSEMLMSAAGAQGGSGGQPSGWWGCIASAGQACADAETFARDRVLDAVHGWQRLCDRIRDHEPPRMWSRPWQFRDKTHAGSVAITTFAMQDQEGSEGEPGVEHSLGAPLHDEHLYKQSKQSLERRRSEPPATRWQWPWPCLRQQDGSQR